MKLSKKMKKLVATGLATVTVATAMMPVAFAVERTDVIRGSDAEATTATISQGLQLQEAIEDAEATVTYDIGTTFLLTDDKTKYVAECNLSYNIENWGTDDYRKDNFKISMNGIEMGLRGGGGEEIEISKIQFKGSELSGSSVLFDVNRSSDADTDTGTFHSEVEKSAVMGKPAGYYTGQISFKCQFS